MLSEQQIKWTQRASELFLRNGIKSVTMDDVARELGISKKTLYLFVESKEDLVNKVLELHFQDEKSQCAEIYSRAADAVDEMFLVIENNAQALKQMKTNIVYDLQKYYREAWEKVIHYHYGFMYGVVRDNLVRGMHEGLYRPDIHVDILAKLHIAASFQLFDEQLFPQEKYPKTTLFKEFLMHFLYGIASEKGLTAIRKRLQELSDE